MTETNQEPLVAEQVELFARAGSEDALEAAIAQAVPLFQASHGCRGFSLERSLDNPTHYRATILWETLDDHLVGFRGSPAFGRWRELVTPHLTEPPKAEHFQDASAGF
ncbi:putative quinol monooxygenase [Nigerium massiliense]|uniref:putative quinol monooxygenase n=1 Tax=Nigerium massiliense TaxID=1522317 RepID=UPI0005912A53|nr:antibiotic biosynthesis monooxygenase family protein [Nigerium massiliense]